MVCPRNPRNPVRARLQLRNSILHMTYFWVPLILCHYAFVAYLSFRAQELGTWQSYGIIWLMGLAPYWILVTRFSKNLVLDGFVYDFAVASGWAIGVAILKGSGFGQTQWIGIALMFSGILIFRS